MAWLPLQMQAKRECKGAVGTLGRHRAFHIFATYILRKVDDLRFGEMR